ncbi:MAG: hypothetical protein OXT69_13095 [Candidatus Poribacteria bacterium]|nr:hypothetical protein [Candidatus Poribacteria bacterium]
MFSEENQDTPPRNFRANLAKSALTALLFLSLALTSAFLMRGHANLEDPAPNDNGENNDQEAPDDMLTPPPGWESWIPTAALGEEDPVTIAFTATVDASDTGSIEFELPYVTSYEGRYMNDAEKVDDYSTDLYFAKCKDQVEITDANGKKVGTWKGGGEDSTSITARWTERPATNADDKIVIPVKIVCNDFAAYGTIKATLTVDGVESESKTHKIPKDDQPVYRTSGGGITLMLEGNTIADAWEDQEEYSSDPQSGNFPIFNPGDDQDFGGNATNSHTITTDPHGRNNGDGFSVLEEYRGFVIGGGYTRLDPFVKEVFIGSLLPSFDGNLKIGAGYIGWHGVSGMTVYQIGDLKTEWKQVPGGAHGSHYWVNYTRGGVVGNRQYGIPIVDGPANDMMGLTDPGHYAALNHGQVCVIDLGLIDDFARPKLGLEVSFAHEIGHAVGLDHHTSVEMNDPTDPDKQLFYPADPFDDSCVMSYAMPNLLWYAYVYRDFHSPVPAGLVPAEGAADPKWEDHWPQYWLHDNHSDHEGYSP